MNNFIKKMKPLCLRKVNSDATGYVQPIQTIQTNLYTNCYREIRKYRRYISFFITPIILSSLIACGAGGGDATTALTSPANIDATSLGFTSLRVTWDNMPQAERYEVYDSNGVKIATVIPPATNYDATGLSPNTEYTYSIKACNSASCSAPVTSTATTSGNKNGGNTIINSVAELNAIRADSSTLAGNYILTVDIDLSSIENWQPIGDSTNSFTGSFDGSGNEISGMTISGNKYAGLFGYVHGASISNLGVRVNNINASSSHAYAGGLAAHANSSLISNVYVIVAKNITSSAAYSSYAGGLFGRIDESRISNSYVVVYGSINSYVSDSSNSYAGGLVGYAHSSLISNSYYSARRVILQGGFTDVTGTYGVAKTVKELQALNATNTDWDSETWNFGTKNDLPILSSEFIPNVEPPPVTAPASPGGVTVTPLSSTSMRVSWNSVSDVKLYRLYDNRGGAVINIAPPATSYNARDLLPNTGYTYRVAACNESGCSVFTKGSAATLPTSVTPPNPVTSPSVPASPSSIRAGSLSLTATSISWDRVDGATSYQVHNNDKLVTTINHPATTSYTVTNLSPNTVYTYSVKACNDSGCSDSIEVTFVTAPIGVSSTPQVSVVASTIGQAMPSLNVSWGRIRGVTSYQIFDAAGDKIATVPAPSINYVDEDLSVGTEYEYKVRGCYASPPGSSEACGDFSEVGSATTPVAIPAVPSGVAATVLGFSSIEISWNRVDGAERYEVRNNNELVTTINNPATTTYTATNLLPATEYTYEVKACNESGCSAAVSRSAVTLPAPVAIPASPSSIRAGSLSLTATSISWNRVDAAKYYEVHNGDKLVTTINHPATTSYTVTNLSPNTVYTYSVKACNDSGCSDSIEVTFVTAPIGVSGAPQVSVVTSTIGQAMPSLNVSWGRIRGVTSYQIFDGDENNIVNVSVPNTSHIIADLSADTLYEYKVRGCYTSSLGSSEACGDFSEVGSATTPVASPAVPNNVAATLQGLTSISISWDSVDGAEYYEVRNSDGLVATIDHPATTYTATNLLPATEYTYSIKACNNYGCSDSASTTATTEDGIIINSATELAAIRANDATLSGNYALTGNIDLSQISNWQPIGNGTNKFTGSFDGNGYNISGVSSSGYQYAGLFGYVENSNIRNVGILVGIISSSSRHFSYSGGLVGFASDSPISNSYAVVEGSISSSAHASDLYSGGLVGRAVDSPISNSYAVVGGSISSSSSLGNSYSGGLVGDASSSPISNSYAVVGGSISSSASFGSYSGGLVGWAYESPISNSYALVTGNISSSAHASDSGGLVGSASSSEISNSYAVVGGSISSSSSSRSDSGGLVGYAYKGPISNSYYSASRESSEGGFSNTLGTSQTLAELRALDATATTWDEDIWDFGTNANLPILRSLPSPAVTPSPASPGDFTATASGLSAISMSWGSVDGAASYEVYNRGVLVTAIKAPATNYIATGLLPNTEYTYSVRACYLFNCSDFVDATAMTPVPPVAIPATPSNVAATSLSFTSISISWDSVVGADNYEVHNNGVLVATIEYPATNYIATGLLPNTEYIYSVSACNDSGCSSAVRDSTITSGNKGDGVTSIGSVAELAAIRANGVTLAGDYYLTGNIDLSDIPNWQPIGDSANKFTGSFDGNGYNISGVSSSGYRYAGLFGYVENADISNVGVLVGNISSSSSTSYSYSGGLVGIAIRNSQISNSYAVVEGSISSSSDDKSNSGGLVGLVSDSPISNSYAVVGGSISSTTSDDDSYSGGLVGRAIRSPISNSYAVVEGNISSSSDDSPSYSGGLVGLAWYSPISNSYALVGGNISSSSSSSSGSLSGGLVGYAYESPISNSYAVVGGSISSLSSSDYDSYSGGLVGNTVRSSISNSYAVVGGGISSLSSSSSHSDSYSGGLVGRIVGNSPISNSYYSASRESSEGEFTNELGTSENLSGLRGLNAGATGWSAGIWDFGSDNDLPMLFDNPLTVDLPSAFRE